MQKFATLGDCIALAEFAHRNQTDKAGLPYIEHPRRVMQAVQAQGALPYVQMAAILHDVTEDTAFTCQMLLDLGVPEPAVEIVKLVDRDHSETKHAGLVRWLKDDRFTWGSELVEAWDYPKDEYYYVQIRKNPGALQVKLADIADNLQEYRLSYLSESTQERLRNKYAKAREILNG